MRKHKIKIPIYFGELILVQDKNFTKISKKLNISENLNNYESFVTTRETNKGQIQYYAVFRKGKIENSIIVHECVHLTNQIFNYTCTQLDINNDEPQAYLTGWLFSQCENFLKNN